MCPLIWHVMLLATFAMASPPYSRGRPSQARPWLNNRLSTCSTASSTQIGGYAPEGTAQSGSDSTSISSTYSSTTTPTTRTTSSVAAASSTTSFPWATADTPSSASSVSSSSMVSTIAGCLEWYVVQPGDFCYTVAERFGITTDTFMAWNPSVLPPSCSRMLAGDAYCVAVCETSTGTAYSSAATPTYSSTTIASSSSPYSVAPTPSSSLSPVDVYRSYNGDGSAAAGWPTESQWISYDGMFEANIPNMEIGCEQWGVPNNSDDEIAVMREAIFSIGNEIELDPRFILAVVMQESVGCVRVITTEYSHKNPGVMQSFMGTGTCNTNQAYLGLPGVPAGTVKTPCPESDIRQQILDGANGTAAGPGLAQNMIQQGHTDVSRWYRTARLYNGGQVVDADLSMPCCTASYASDIANRMTGWVNAARTFTAA